MGILDNMLAAKEKEGLKEIFKNAKKIKRLEPSKPLFAREESHEDMQKRTDRNLKIEEARQSIARKFSEIYDEVYGAIQSGKAHEKDKDGRTILDKLKAVENKFGITDVEPDYKKIYNQMKDSIHNAVKNELAAAAAIQQQQAAQEAQLRAENQQRALQAKLFDQKRNDLVKPAGKPTKAEQKLPSEQKVEASKVTEIPPKDSDIARKILNEINAMLKMEIANQAKLPKAKTARAEHFNALRLLQNANGVIDKCEKYKKALKDEGVKPEEIEKQVKNLVNLDEVQKIQKDNKKIYESTKEQADKALGKASHPRSQSEPSAEPKPPAQQAGQSFIAHSARETSKSHTQGKSDSLQEMQATSFEETAKKQKQERSQQTRQ